MPPSSSAEQPTRGRYDILLKMQSTQDIQGSHLQFAIRKISPNPYSLYRLVKKIKLEQEKDKKYWKLTHQSDSNCILGKKLT